MRAERAPSPHLQRECTREAALIAEMIGDVQCASGAGAAAGWHRLGPIRPARRKPLARRPARMPAPANGNAA
jgi:hypothetical protein